MALQKVSNVYYFRLRTSFLHLLLTGQKRKNPNQVFAKIPSFFTQPKDMHIKLICDSIMPSGVSVVRWMSLCASLGQLG